MAEGDSPAADRHPSWHDPDLPGLDGLVSEPLGALVDAAETGAARPERRRRWVLPLRIGASLAMLAIIWWRFPHLSWSNVLPDWDGDSIGWMAGALVLTFAAIILSAVRWQQTLLALDLRSRLRPLVNLEFAGQFVSNVLPSTIGGDVLRVSRLSRSNGESARTFASVVLERLTGWLVLPLITFFGLVVNPDLRGLGRSSSIAFLIALGTLIALVVLLVAASHPRVGGRFGSSEGWQRFIEAVHQGVAGLRRDPARALGVIGAGLIYQITLCVAALMVAASLGFGWLGITALLAFFPAVLIAQVLPIGIAGLGVREGAFVLFLTPLGVPAEQAVALGLVLYALNVIVSLAGAPSFAIGGRRRIAAA